MTKKLKTIAILASGNGSNAENIVKAVKTRKLKAHIALIFSDKRKAKVLKRAEKLNIPYVSFEPKDFKSKKEYEKVLIKLLKAEKIDYVVLAGYMQILSKEFISAYKNRIINIHPSLLPAFKGAEAIKDAYQYGVRVSGATVHFVVPEVDSGPIILQKTVEIKKGESLARFEDKIHKAEYEILPQALRLVLEGKTKLKANKVTINK